jgi:hypothetical protein
MGRRVHIDSDDVTQLVDEQRIVGQIELPSAVGLKAVRLPDAAYDAGADAGGFRHHVDGPVRTFAKRILQRQRHQALGRFRTERRNARWPRLFAQQSFEACRGEALVPAPHAGLGLAGLPHDLDGPGAVGAQQEDLGAPDALLRRIRSLKTVISRCDRLAKRRRIFLCACARLAFAFAKENRRTKSPSPLPKTRLAPGGASHKAMRFPIFYIARAL